MSCSWQLLHFSVPGPDLWFLGGSQSLNGCLLAIQFSDRMHACLIYSHPGFVSLCYIKIIRQAILIFLAVFEEQTKRKIYICLKRTCVCVCTRTCKHAHAQAHMRVHKYTCAVVWVFGLGEKREDQCALCALEFLEGIIENSVYNSPENISSEKL